MPALEKRVEVVPGLKLPTGEVGAGLEGTSVRGATCKQYSAIRTECRLSESILPDTAMSHTATTPDASRTL